SWMVEKSPRASASSSSTMASTTRSKCCSSRALRRKRKQATKHLPARLFRPTGALLRKPNQPAKRRGRVAPGANDASLHRVFMAHFRENQMSKRSSATADDDDRAPLVSTRLSATDQPPLFIELCVEVPKPDQTADPAERVIEALSQSLQALGWRP